MKDPMEHFNPFWRLKRKAEWGRAVSLGISAVLERSEQLLREWGIEQHQYDFEVAPVVGVDVDEFEATPPDQARSVARIVFTIRAPGYAPTNVSCDLKGNFTNRGCPVSGPEDLWAAVRRNELPSHRPSR